jgi:hypothetical protein
MTWNRKYRKSSGSISWTVELSGWIWEAEQLFLGLPTQREIATTGGQKLRGEFRWLPAFR